MKPTIVLGALLLAAGCGVDKDLHAKVVKDLEDHRARLADLEQTSASRIAALEKESGDLKTELARREQAIENLGKTAADRQKKIEELAKGKELEERRAKTYRDLVARLRKMIDSKKLRVALRDGKMVVQLPSGVLFDSGRTDIKADGRATLAEVAQALKEITDRAFLIGGHTDNKPLRGGRYRSNWELSAARAVEVVKLLQDQGVNPKQLAAAGFSEFDPIGDNAAAEGAAQNRRIEIILMPNVEELPTTAVE